MMKIHPLSDLHNEYTKYRLHSAASTADVIVLAGDIGEGIKGVEYASEVSQQTGKPVIYVAGNHEHYNQEVVRNKSNMCEAAQREGVHFLENDEVIINGVRFLGCTLWTDFELFGQAEKPYCLVDGKRSLADFRVIRNGSALFTPEDSIALNNDSVWWLEMKLRHESFAGQTVVVTHHLPSFGSVSPRYAKDNLSACFASRLDNLIGFNPLWIHGHTHESFSYVENGTQIVCNPRGYCLPNRDIENSMFDPTMIIQLEEDSIEILSEKAQAAKPVRQGWAEASKRIAVGGDDAMDRYR